MKNIVASSCSTQCPASAGLVSLSVMVLITVGVNGGVIDARVLTPAPLLEQAALTAVKQWEYDAGGIRAAVNLTVTVPFVSPKR